MSEKRIFEVGRIEYPETILYYRSVKIDVNDYPELKDMTDDEIISYIKENAHEMKSLKEYYDSLGEEISDQDVIREKIPHVGSDIWVDVSSDEDGEDDYED